MIPTEIQIIVLAMFAAVASGLVGSFALMRRMTLAGDAFAHVALPGISLALLYGYNPILGGVIMLFAGTAVIWMTQKRSALNTEAVVGVLFSLSLAAGAILIEEEHELIEALFGGMGTMTVSEFIFGFLASIFIIFFILRNSRQLTLSLISKELALTSGIQPARLEFYFLAIFALTVALGMRFLGVLLMGALIIIPAAAAHNFAHNLKGMLAGAAAIALLSVIAGIFASDALKIELGPAIIIISGILFFISLCFAIKNKK